MPANERLGRNPKYLRAMRPHEDELRLQRDAGKGEWVDVLVAPAGSPAGVAVGIRLVENVQALVRQINDPILRYARFGVKPGKGLSAVTGNCLCLPAWVALHGNERGKAAEMRTYVLFRVKVKTKWIRCQGRGMPLAT